MTDPLILSAKPKLHNSTLIVGWESDAAHLGSNVTEYLTKNLNGEAFCEIDPAEFFPLGGVVVENDIVQFPQSTFYACPEHDIVIFQSAIPRYEWFKFMNLIIDVAQEYCHAKEIYTIGGMITLAAHTTPRDSWATFNSPQIKKILKSYQLSREMDFETPPGGRPTLNSFLLWVAKTRNLAGANLWVPMPFYLITASDPEASKKVLEFFDDRLDLSLDFEDIDASIKHLNEKLMRLRRSSSEIDGYIRKLESDIQLSEEEHESLVKAVDDCLKKKRT
jgi:proteasome assembly chaperone (PAC2) family protein